MSAIERNKGGSECMEIRRWITVNISFNESERAVAEKVIKSYLARDYDDNDEDDGVDYEICHQLISQTTIREKGGKQ